MLILKIIIFPMEKKEKEEKGINNKRIKRKQECNGVVGT